GFDALLTDVQMPGSIDGIRVATHARQRHAHIPVIVVSAQPDHAQRIAGLIPPGTFVSKPYDFAFLMKTLRHMLGAANA
ncbi:MAG TPA: response regulator, partial [Acetobacteraceae bacterium]|nr:response regulator [Acetobacteraceae bacterium]